MLFVPLSPDEVAPVVWFCSECGDNFHIMDGCSCGVDEMASVERLYFMSQKWGCESETFDSFLPYPSNFMLIGPKGHLYTTMFTNNIATKLR